MNSRKSQHTPARSTSSGDTSQRGEHPDEGVEDIMPTVYTEPEDVVAVAELAEAERAVARHDASPAQVRGVEAAAQHRRGEDRVESWRREW